MQTIVPMLAYEDGVAALEWLCQAFGFQEKTRCVDENGVLAHGEIALGDQIIMLAMPSPDYQGLKKHREHCEAARKWSEVPWVINGVMVYVDDIQAQYRQAKAAGATILSELEATYIGTRYRAEDLEGQRWMFVQMPKAGTGL